MKIEQNKLSPTLMTLWSEDGQKFDLTSVPMQGNVWIASASPMNETPSKINKCPFCAGIDGSFSKLGKRGRVQLLKCSHCGGVFADRSVWSNPYEDKDYYDPINQPIEQYPLKFGATEIDRLSLLSQRITSGRLLDFGGGLGRTALAAHSIGFQTTILEESEKAIEYGKRFHPELTWVQGSSIPATFEQGSYSAITMFHVLEHICEPKSVIESFARILKSGGYLVIEVPNWGSNMRRLRGLDWVYMLDHHVNYFTRDSLKRLVESCGFKLETVQYRRTFAVNEKHPWKDPIKKLLCLLGFGDVVRCMFRRE